MPVSLRPRRLDPESDDEKAACQAFQFGDEPWDKYVCKWITERLWEEDPHERGETIIFEDAATAEFVGYVTWRFRKVRLPHDDKQHKVIQLHYIGVVPKYQREKCEREHKDDPVESLVRRMVATAEAEGRKHSKARPETLLQLEVEVGNDHARGVYVGGLGFTSLGFREAPNGRRYELLARSAPEVVADPAAAAAGGKEGSA